MKLITFICLPYFLLSFYAPKKDSSARGSVFILRFPRVDDEKKVDERKLIPSHHLHLPYFLLPFYASKKTPVQEEVVFISSFPRLDDEKKGRSKETHPFSSPSSHHSPSLFPLSFHVPKTDSEEANGVLILSLPRWRKRKEGRKVLGGEMLHADDPLAGYNVICYSFDISGQQVSVMQE